jgi:hypothetical protein
MRHSCRLALALCVLLSSSVSAFGADEKSFGAKILDGALSSAGGKGGEFAVKFAAGWIYKLGCKPEQTTDPGSKAFCDALGSISGDTESEWKKQVEADLKEIKSRLGGLESGQRQILDTLARQHKEMDAQFKQLPSAVKAADVLTTIDSFWGRFKADFDPQQKGNVTRKDLDKFARDVMRVNLHQKLSELNSVLVHPIDNAQPILKFPFYQFRQSWSQHGPPEAFPGFKTYDFAEKKYMYYRGEMHKGYLIYLWAAEIIEGQCELAGDTKCNDLPITSTAFKREYDRFTLEQLEAFNSFANGMLLAYSRPDLDGPDFLVRNPVYEDIMMRINYLTSTILGDGKGAWGQVVSVDADPWDGQIRLQCGGSKTVSPVLSYLVPADTIDGPTIDWWSSRQRNATYDEVRFTSNWRVHHYKVADAAVGPCRVDPVLPTGQPLPYAPQKGEVVSAPRPVDEFKNGEAVEKTVNLGFFYALQRAGGTFALASGQDWALPAAPETFDEGKASKKDTRFDWVISAAHHEGLWVSLLNSARVDWSAGIDPSSQKAYVMNRVYAYNRKSLWFPQGGNVKLIAKQHQWCEKVCRGTERETGFMDFNVENSPYEAGYLNADVSVFLDPREGIDNIDSRKKNGIYIDGSYPNTNDPKSKRVEDAVIGTARVDASTAYHLQYFLAFELETHTKRMDPTRYHVMLKMTPRLMYLTR